MKPNYKALAEKYRKRWGKAEETISHLMIANSHLDADLRKKDQELYEWKTKYVQVLNAYIESQERIARMEEGNG